MTSPPATLFSHHFFLHSVSHHSDRQRSVVDGVETKTEQLHRKQRMVLYVFLGLLRTRNWLLLKHYAMVEPLAYWFQNVRQRGRCSLSGSFSYTLRTVWRNLHKMHTRCQEQFNETLQLIPHLHAAFDNHINVVVNK